MQVLGYSERGVINSFFYEMAFTHLSKSIELFDEFIKLIKPMIDGVKLPKFKLKSGTLPTIIIEPSFSDFGDADAVIMFEDENIGKTVLFVEAKVCAEKSWNFARNVLLHLVEGFNKISKGVKPKSDYSSNLLIQLYHKYHMIKERKKLISSTSPAFSLRLPLSPLYHKGKQIKRKIGANNCVRKVLEFIDSSLTEGNDYYISIIPTDSWGEKSTSSGLTHTFELNKNVDINYKLYDIGLPNRLFNNYSGCQGKQPFLTIDFKDMVPKLGYITWGEIHKLVINEKMTNTTKVFKLNQADGSGGTKNQIYNPK